MERSTAPKWPQAVLAGPGPVRPWTAYSSWPRGEAARRMAVIGPPQRPKGPSAQEAPSQPGRKFHAFPTEGTAAATLRPAGALAVILKHQTD
jgi:hypothetical protein